MQTIKIKERRYYPMIVSEKGTEDPVSSEFLENVWKQFDALSPDKKEIINSYEMANKILELQKQFGITDAQIGMVSLMIRQLFFGEIDLGGIESKLRSFFSAQVGSDPNRSKAVVEFIQKEILTLTPPKPEISESTESSTIGKVVRLPLLKAMGQYENLGYQSITNDKIKIKGQPEPQRPSLGNWIRYYRDELGIGFHDQVLRGRFLFQSENGKRLSNEERERVNLVLKSIEEEFPIDIDTEHQVIVFPVRAKTPAAVSQATTRPLFPPREGAVPSRSVKPFQPSVSPQGLPVTPSVAPTPPQPVLSKPSFFTSKLSPAKNVAGETLHFSTGHVLPGEKNGAKPEVKPMPSTSPTTPPVSVHPVVSQPTVPPVSSFRPSGINQNRGNTLPRSPYSIRPLRLRNDVGEKEE